jgi:hypothetical protein
MEPLSSDLDKRLPAIRARDVILAALQAAFANEGLFGEGFNPFLYVPNDASKSSLWICTPESKNDFSGRDGRRSLITVERSDYVPQDMHLQNHIGGGFNDTLDYSDLGSTTLMVRCEAGNETESEVLASVSYGVLKIFRPQLMESYDIFNLKPVSISPPVRADDTPGVPWVTIVHLRLEVQEYAHMVEIANRLNRLDIDQALANQEHLTITSLDATPEPFRMGPSGDAFEVPEEPVPPQGPEADAPDPEPQPPADLLANWDMTVATSEAEVRTVPDLTGNRGPLVNNEALLVTGYAGKPAAQFPDSGYQQQYEVPNFPEDTDIHILFVVQGFQTGYWGDPRNIGGVVSYGLASNYIGRVQDSDNAGTDNGSTGGSWSDAPVKYLNGTDFTASLAVDLAAAWKGYSGIFEITGRVGMPNVEILPGQAGKISQIIVTTADKRAAAYSFLAQRYGIGV